MRSALSHCSSASWPPLWPTQMALGLGVARQGVAQARLTRGTWAVILPLEVILPPEVGIPPKAYLAGVLAVARDRRALNSL